MSNTSNIPAEIDALLKEYAGTRITREMGPPELANAAWQKLGLRAIEAIPAIRALVEERESHIHEIAALQVFNKVLNTTTKLLETKNEELCLENNSLQAENERLKAAASVTYEVKQLTEQEAQVVDEFFLGPKPNDQD